MKQKWLDAAQAVAIAAHGTGRRESFRIGSILLHPKRGLITASTNSYKTHPFLTRYTKYPHQHAETACILRHGLDNCHGHDLVVARVDKKNRLTMSKPCSVCMAVIRDVSIRNVWYTDWEGKFECLNVT